MLVWQKRPKFIERLGSYYLSDKEELLVISYFSERPKYPHETYRNSISSRSRDVEFLRVCAIRRR
jgi:hypothetical protein